MSLACRVSLHPEQKSSALKRALDAYPATSDPLWRALARHITRRASDDEKRLLLDLAAHPEKRDPPLRWGLQYIVRGDVILEDGTELTLDELAKDAHLEPLPYLVDPAPDALWRERPE
jgi:hypothetical protein